MIVGRLFLVHDLQGDLKVMVKMHNARRQHKMSHFLVENMRPVLSKQASKQAMRRQGGFGASCVDKYLWPDLVVLLNVLQD